MYGNASSSRQECYEQRHFDKLVASLAATHPYHARVKSGKRPGSPQPIEGGGPVASPPEEHYRDASTINASPLDGAMH